MKDTQPPSKLPEQEYEVERFFAMVYHPCKNQADKFIKECKTGCIT